MRFFAASIFPRIHATSLTVRISAGEERENGKKKNAKREKVRRECPAVSRKRNYLNGVAIKDAFALSYGTREKRKISPGSYMLSASRRRGFPLAISILINFRPSYARQKRVDLSACASHS